MQYYGPRGKRAERGVSYRQGYQSMTQACGMLEMKEQRDAFLTSLCRFTLTDALDSDHSAGGRSEGIATTSGETPALLAHTCSQVISLSVGMHRHAL